MGFITDEADGCIIQGDPETIVLYLTRRAIVVNYAKLLARAFPNINFA